MTTTEKMIALLRRLKSEMNGAVTDAMRGYGGGMQGYGLNYGVSLPTIREIARAYAPDHELAGLLWQQDVRELKLAALFVEDPAAVTTAQMEAWAAEWRGTELVEQCAMQLFWRSPDALRQAEAWAVLSGPEGAMRRLAAFYLLGKLAAAGEKVSDPAFAELLDNTRIFGPDTTERSAVYALREIYRHRPELHESVFACLNRLPQPVSDEVRWQIDYL